MATNCTIIGQAFGYAYLSDYSKNTAAYAGYAGGTSRYAYVLKFETPNFNGVSQSIDFNIVMHMGQGGSNVNLRYAICTSDANATSYMQTTNEITDANQITSGNVTISGVPSTYSAKTITIPATNLNPSQTYYLILWSYDNTGIEIYTTYSGAPFGEHTVTLNTVQGYTLSISAGTGSTITVNRTSSTYGTTGNLSNGATIYDGDKLKITFSAKTGYNISTRTVNGSTFTSGNTHTVSGDVTVKSTAAKKTYTLSISAGTGSTITVKKGSTTLSNGATITHGDTLTITFGASTGYNLSTRTVNGTTFTSGNTYTVSGDVSVAATATKKTYTLTISKGTGSSITVKNGDTSLSNGATITHGDTLTITFGTSTGYNLSTHTVNGSTFTSGNTHTVSGDVIVTTIATVKSYTLSISAGTGSTITVNRTSSPKQGATTGNLSNGAMIYYDDVLKISFSASTGYDINTHTVNDSSFTSGNSYTVSSAVAVKSTATVKSFTLSISAGTNSTIVVNRTSSPKQGAETGNLSNGATIYYSDSLNITTSVDSPYRIIEQTLNGSPFLSGLTHTVSNHVSIVVDTEELNENDGDQYLINASTLTSIANAIREKTKKERALTPDEMVTEIGTLSREEFLPHADIPGYVKEEAMKIAEKVRAVQTEDSITFLAMADSHHCGEQSDTDWKDYINLGNLHATMGAKVVSYLINMDFACYLGDITFGSNTTTSELLHQQIAEFNSWLDESYKGLLQFRTVGNHDTGMYAYQAGNAELETADYLYDVIGSYCEITPNKYKDLVYIYGDADYRYGYRDFYAKKLRVICLNTSEGDTIGSSEYECSPKQLCWLANALYGVDNKWGSDGKIIILGHYPLDFSSAYPASSVLKAYIDGTSITLNGETFDFNGHNSAKVIGQFHGHTHCFKYAKLNEIDSETNAATEYDAWRIAVPNSCFYRSNHQEGVSEHGIRFGEDYTYDKSIGNANDTAFVVNVIVPSKEVIYSFCYGAGYDRVIGYGNTTYHSIKSFLSNLSITNEVGGVKEGESFNATLIPDEYAVLSHVSITMDGVDITSDVYENCVINIPEVTGDVIITARAVLNLDCVNQIPISTDVDGDIYNDVGYKGMTFIVGNSGESSSSGVSTTGFIPFEHGDVIRLYNMNFVKGVGQHRLAFYDANKNYIGIAIASSPYFMDTAYQGLINDASNYTQFTLWNTYYAPSKGAAYVRISCANITGASVVTINEEIQYVDVVDGTYSIVNQLINATNNNTAKFVAYNAGYTANIAAEAGYELDNVTVTMDGVDVTSDVYSNGVVSIPVVSGDIVITVTTTMKEVVMHSITNNLTYTVNSNATASVEDGSSYTANITAQDGYELDSVIVTMGGTDITSSVYSDGTINISNVTGNIIITAVATAISSGAYTNQIPISTDTDGSIYNGKGYNTGYYISSSGGALSSRTGSYVTGFIPCKVNDVVRLQNVNFDSDSSDKSYHRVAFYNSSKTYIGMFNGQSVAVPDNSVQNSDGVWTQFGIKTSMGGVDYSSVAYLRLCCSGIDDTSIITINEEIVSTPTSSYAVTNNLTYAINSNSSTSVEAGSNYIANISAESGYELDSVSVTMGGTDVTSSVYSNGSINISSVTGDIVITVVAIVSLKYTNQIPISTDTDGTVFNGTGYQSGYRLNSSGALSSLSGCYVTGFIPCKVGDIIRMKNITFQYGVTTDPNSGNQRLSFYDSSKAHILQTNATGLGGVCDGVKGDDGIWTQFTVKKSMSNVDCSATAYFRINAAYIGADSIITVNEEIVDITSTTLYDAGDQCTSVTGGWTNSGWTYYEDPIVSSTIGNTSMTVTGSYNSTTRKSSNSIVGTINKISLDSVSKIYADLEITAIGTVYLRACSTTDTGYSDASAVVATTGTHTIELDVSSLTGDYYIVFVAAGTSGYGYYPSANITKVWAE